MLAIQCTITRRQRSRELQSIRTEITVLLFSHLTESNSLRPHGVLLARLPCPSPYPRTCLNSCPLRRDAIQPCHLLSFPSPPAFNLSHIHGLWLFASSGQSVGDFILTETSSNALIGKEEINVYLFTDKMIAYVARSMGPTKDLL